MMIFIARRKSHFNLNRNAIFLCFSRVEENFVIYTRVESLIDFNVNLKSLYKELKRVKGFWLLISASRSENQLKSQRHFPCTFLCLRTIHPWLNVLSFLNYPVHYCFAVIYLCKEESDANVMMLIKQSKTMIFISQPHAIPSENSPLEVRGEWKKLNEPFHYFDIKCNARVIEAGCSSTNWKIIYNVSFDAREIVACGIARLSENQRRVANRSDDTKTVLRRNLCRIEMFARW